MLLREHRGPLAADLRRYYSCSLRDVLLGDVAPLAEVAAWVAHLPSDSAVQRTANPAWQHTIDLELARAQEHSLRHLVWQNSGGKGRKPEPVEFKWEQIERQGTWRGDALDWDEAAEKLGGDSRLARLLAA